MTLTNKNLATIQKHFDYEAAREIDLIATTYADDIVWEAPARHVCISGKAEVIKNYQYCVVK